MTEAALRRALVTGGSGDIGAAICRRLARDGLHVVVHANRNLERAKGLVAEVGNAGGSAEVIAFDVTQAQATAERLRTLLQAGPIQVLVSNAGGYRDAPMAGMNQAQWRYPIDVSLHGFFNVAQPLLLPMMATRWGRIIAISSVAGVIAGHITTREFAADAIKRLVPMKRAGTPDEVAALVAFLASNDAAYISGQIISVNGGMA